MKLPLIAKMPWDMVVFLTITTVGFGLSVKRLATSGSLRSVASVELTETSLSDAHRTTGILAIELGCLDRSGGSKSTEITQSVVRLKGKFCDLPKEENKEAIGTVRIKNLTTGSESVVYISGPSAFVTDGLDLKGGKNTLAMEWKNKSLTKTFKTDIYSKN